jgi:hypothetical protein
MASKIWQISNFEDHILVFNGVKGNWLFKKSEVILTHKESDVFLKEDDVELKISYYNFINPEVNSGQELFDILQGYIQEWWDAQGQTQKDILEEITNPTNLSNQEKQDELISKLASLDAKTYGINPKIEESPQELLRLIHSGLDILTEQQIITNNLLKLILS